MSGYFSTSFIVHEILQQLLHKKVSKILEAAIYVTLVSQRFMILSAQNYMGSLSLTLGLMFYSLTLVDQ